MRIRRMWPIFVSIFVFLVPNQAFAQNEATLKSIIELAWEDTETFSLESVVKQCSDVLSNRDKHSHETVAEALARRGNAYARLKKLDESLTDLDALCDLRPKAAKPRTMRASTLAMMGELERAVIDAKAAIALEPKFAPGHVALGFLLLSERKFDEANASAKKALELDLDYAKADYLRALIAYERSDLNECLALVNRYLEKRPLPDLGDVEHPYNLRGWIMLRMNRPTDALSNFLVARKLNPKSYTATQNIYLTYKDMQKWHMAAAIGEQLTMLRPNAMDSHLLLAFAKAKNGETQAAKKSLEIALRVAPPIAPAMENAYCGNIYFLLGNYEDALKCFDNALELDSNCGYALSGRIAVLSICKDVKLRNGKQAIKLANTYKENAKRQWGTDHYLTFVLLADAEAEIENFGAAFRHAQKAIELAGPDRNTQDIHLRLKLFQAKRQYRHELPVD